MTKKPIRTGGNPNAKQAGIDQRRRIVELVTADADNGGDGITRAQLAAEFGLSRPTVHRHVTELIEEGRVEQVGRKLVPSGVGHVHICRICGETMGTGHG